MREKPENIFREKGGQLRMSEALANGISRYMLYSLRDKGIIEQVSRGIYRLVELPPISNPDLVTVSLRYPNAVICLVSALAFHDMTTQVPHKVSVAILKDSKIRGKKYPPIETHWFSKPAYEAGVEEHRIDGALVKIHNPEKTLADCFKFRNKIGMDVVLEALRLYKARKRVKLNEVLKYAKVCRVEKIITPYLEASV